MYFVVETHLSRILCIFNKISLCKQTSRLRFWKIYVKLKSSKFTSSLYNRKLFLYFWNYKNHLRWFSETGFFPNRTDFPGRIINITKTYQTSKVKNVAINATAKIFSTNSSFLVFLIWSLGIFKNVAGALLRVGSDRDLVRFKNSWIRPRNSSDKNSVTSLRWQFYDKRLT